MREIYDPVSGEKGYFCTETQKVLIDAILHDYSMNQLVTNESSTVNGRGVEL